MNLNLLALPISIQWAGRYYIIQLMGKRKELLVIFSLLTINTLIIKVTIEQFKSGERLIDLHRPIPVSLGLNWTETKVEHGIGLCWNEYASTKISQLDNQYEKILSYHSVEWFHNIKIKHLKKNIRSLTCI